MKYRKLTAEQRHTIQEYYMFKRLLLEEALMQSFKFLEPEFSSKDVDKKKVSTEAQTTICHAAELGKIQMTQDEDSALSAATKNPEILIEIQEKLQQLIQPESTGA